MPVRKKKEERRMKVSATIKPDLYNWMEKKINEGKFYNKSHVLQEAIRLLQKQDE